MSQLPAFISGSSDWRRLLGDVRRMERAVFGGGMTGLNMPSGRTVVQGSSETVQVPFLHEFKITDGTGFPDSVVCTKTETGDTGIHVAKPYLARRTPFDAKRRDGIEFAYTSHYERKATRKEPPPPQGQSEPTENQIGNPKWVTGDLIYCARVYGGVTGIKAAVGDTDDLSVSWIVVEIDGRSFAKV